MTYLFRLVWCVCLKAYQPFMVNSMPKYYSFVSVGAFFLFFFLFCFVWLGRFLWQLHKNAISYIKQILEARPHESRAVRQFTSRLENHPSQTNKTCGTMLKKQGRAHKWCFLIDPYSRTCQGWPTSKTLPTTVLRQPRMLLRRPSGIYGR